MPDVRGSSDVSRKQRRRTRGPPHTPSITTSAYQPIRGCIICLLFLPFEVTNGEDLVRIESHVHGAFSLALEPRKPVSSSGRRKTREPKEENVTLGPAVREGEQVFGVAHIFASFNDTFIHVTDLSGRETLVLQCSVLALNILLIVIRKLCWLQCGMKVKADRDESSPYAAMLSAQDVAQRCKELGITALHIKLRATGGNKTKTPGPGAQSALRALARSGMKIGRIEDVTAVHIQTGLTVFLCGIAEDVTPIPTDSTRRKGGRRGRRL
ncbi:hypothetical protein C4D60_Mb06t08060 [Musa balbisiana]|uniref:Small ribosomal subunit protein uS11 n=1 Tax=Musa balbisiana TaxID=52838 RepID=A0A4V6T434_MUSBA|nr:hypothetical protein C4D60_Mb06t08060 [Musa balbisiana]